jgi:cytosine deaminase
MGVDLVVRRAQLAPAGDRPPVDVAVDGGRIVAVEPDLDVEGPELRADGRLVVPGLVETHLHLDKAHVAGPDLASGGLQAALAATARAKAGFTPDDVHERAARVLRAGVAHGTTAVRTHVELDPTVGLRGLDGVLAAAAELAGLVSVEVCVFAQEGLSDQPQTRALLVEGLERGATAVGGAPYTDRDPRAQIDLVFDLARAFDVAVDLHLDLAETLEGMQIDHVCRKADETGLGGRVTVGHVTQLALLSPAELDRTARRVAAAGVAVTTLPATDLFLMGRRSPARPRGVAPLGALRRHGVTCSISTNNVMNAFTPYGDASLVRMANLYANVAHVADPEGLADCLSMVTDQAAAIAGLTGYGFDVGSPADLVALDAPSAAEAVARIAPAVWGVKRGRPTFTRPAVVLHQSAAPTTIEVGPR